MSSKTLERQVDRLKEILGEEDVVPSEQNFKHNWMYSFLYADTPEVGLVTFQFYLCGYCKNCNKGITVLMKRNFVPGTPEISDLDVPKFGCAAPPSSLGM